MTKKLLLGLTFTLLTSFFALAQSDYVLQFDAATENQSIKYADDATTSMMDGATDYTFEMWVKPNSNSASGEVWLSMRNMARITFWSNNRFYFTHKDNSTGTVTNTFYNSTTNAITIDEWNHIAVICNSTDGANGSIKLYVNGVDVTASAYDAKPLVGGDANNDVFVSYGGGDYSNMMAREIRIKKTAEDVANLHTALTDPNYTTDADTAVLFNFAEGTGLTTVNAASGIDANFGFGGAHYPTWVLLADTLATKSESIADFSIYPNPANDIVNIQSNETLKNVSIFNILGKQVFNQNNNLETLNLSNLNAGIYLIKVETEQGIGTRKLVIK